jgi:hypothetical protein
MGLVSEPMPELASYSDLSRYLSNSIHHLAICPSRQIPGRLVIYWLQKSLDDLPPELPPGSSHQDSMARVSSWLVGR